MIGRVVLLGCLVASGCENNDSEGGFETTAPAPRGSGGFSADLAKELGSGGDKPAPKVATNDTAKPDEKDPKADATATKTDATDAKDTKPDAKDAKTDAKDTKPDAKDTKTDAKDTKRVTSGDRPPGNDAPPTGTAPVAIDTAKPRVRMKPSPEIAAIKISLSPNWDRDVGEAGTISLVVKIPNTDNTRVFAFRYGYEDPKAPTDREAYKKWLASKGILGANPNGHIVDRQRGGSWYLEGVDGSGAPVFRMISVFGGKKLICGGSLYKDSASNQLGDIRDKTILQAKEICESLSL